MSEGRRAEARDVERWLAVLTGDGDRDEVYTAIVELRAMGDAVVPALLGILSDPAHHAGARSRAADLLADLRATAAVGPLIETLEQAPVLLRWSIAIALGRLGDPSAIPALEKLVRHDDGEETPSRGFTIRVRDAAAEALERLHRGR